MMLYLSGHSRPDIAYAVNFYARYMFGARLSHEKAIKRLGDISRQPEIGD